MLGDGRPVMRAQGPAADRFKYQKGVQAICNGEHHHRTVDKATIYYMLFERFYANFAGVGKVKVPRDQLLHAFVTSIRDEPIEAELQNMQLFLEQIDLGKLQAGRRVKDVVGEDYGNKHIMVLDKAEDGDANDIEKWPSDVKEVPIFPRKAGEHGTQSFIANRDSFLLSKNAYDKFVSLIFPDEHIADESELLRGGFEQTVVKSMQALARNLNNIVMRRAERGLSPGEKGLHEFLHTIAVREQRQTTEKLKVLTNQSRSTLAGASSQDSISYTQDTTYNRVRNAQTLAANDMPKKALFAKETVKLSLNQASKRFAINPTHCTFEELQNREDVDSLLKLQYVSKAHNVVPNSKFITAFSETTLTLSDDYFNQGHAEILAAMIMTGESAYEVRKLVVDTNSLDDASLGVIFRALDSQGLCRSFTIRRAQIGPQVTGLLIQIFERLGREGTATELRLCHIERLQVQQTAMILKALSTRYTKRLQLTGLDVSKDAVPPLLQFLDDVKLVELDLSWAKIPARALEAVLSELANNPEDGLLEKLGMRGLTVFSQISAECKEVFCQWLQHSDVRHLDLGWMGLRKDILPLLKSLGNSVQAVQLEGNGIDEELLVKELGLTESKLDVQIPQSRITIMEHTISSHVETSIQKSLRSSIDKSEESLTIVRNPLPSPLCLKSMLPTLSYTTETCPLSAPSALVQIFYRRSNPKNWDMTKSGGVEQRGFPVLSGFGKMVPVKAQATAVKIVEEQSVGGQAETLVKVVEAVERGEGEGMLSMVGVWREKLIPGGLQPGLVIGALPFDLGRPDEDDIFVWQGRVAEGRWSLHLTDPELGCEFEHAQDMVVFGDEYRHYCVWEGDKKQENKYYHDVIVQDLFKEVMDDYSDEKMAKVRHELPNANEIQATCTVNEHLANSIQQILIAEQKLVYKLYTYLDVARIGVRPPLEILKEVLPEKWHDALSNSYMSGLDRRGFVMMLLKMLSMEDPVEQLQEIVLAIRQWMEESPEKRDITIMRTINVLLDWAVADVVRAVDKNVLEAVHRVERMEWLQAQAKSVTGEYSQRLFMILAALSRGKKAKATTEPFLLGEVVPIDLEELHANLKKVFKVEIKAPGDYERPRIDLNYYQCLQSCLGMAPAKALAQTRKLFGSFKP